MATGFDEVIQLIRLPRVLAFPGFDHVDLYPSGCEGPEPPTDAEQHYLGGIAKVKPDATPVGATILPDLVPNDVCLVLKSPGIQYLKTLPQQGIGHPEIEMALLRRHHRNRKAFDGLEGQRCIAGKTPMFGSHLARPVGKLPRRIRQNGAVGVVTHLTQKVLGWR